MSKYLIKGETLNNIANAIREKTGDTASITVGNFPEAIRSIDVSNGIDTSDATATINDIIEGKTAYANGEKIEGVLKIQTYYKGDTEPSNDLGQDGDLYLMKG